MEIKTGIWVLSAAFSMWIASASIVMARPLQMQPLHIWGDSAQGFTAGEHGQITHIIDGDSLVLTGGLRSRSAVYRRPNLIGRSQMTLRLI